MSYSELEIGLRETDAGTLEAELRLSIPSDQGEREPVRGPFSIDFDSLLEQGLDPAGYGKLLADGLFQDPAVRDCYRDARNTTEANDARLRIRLWLGRSARLASVRWELLRCPIAEKPIAIAFSQNILFSRFVSSNDFRPIKLRRKAELKAVIAVSAPANHVVKQLAKVDLDGEIRRARTALSPIGDNRVTVVGKDQPLTLDALIAGLGSGVDILYLVCHGELSKSGVPSICLLDAAGNAAWTPGEALIERVQSLAEPPRLAVLASCDSGGSEAVLPAATAGDITALAPGLAKAGIPAVIAMQGKVSMATVEKAMPLFFAELVKDGQIDRAMAVARDAIRQHADCWMPALYLRIKGGRIWYEPGFAADGTDSDKEDINWTPIETSLKKQKLTPIIGSGLVEHVYGTAQQTARQLAVDPQRPFPLEPYEQGDLARVTQYLRVKHGLDTARDKVEQEEERRLRELHPWVATPYPKTGSLPLADLIRRVGERLWEASDSDEPHLIIAKHLPSKVYITANTDDLLQRALERVLAPSKPQHRVCDWYGREDVPAAETTTPSPERPLVYYAFGHRDPAYAESVVLTEDDYFDYMLGIAQPMPPNGVSRAVEEAVSSTSLLFLGFQLTDWSFRVLTRWALGFGGSHLLTRNSHVAAQIDPNEGGFVDARAARGYIERYFAGTYLANLSIYWGTADDFLRDLRARPAFAATSGVDGDAGGSQPAANGGTDD